MKEQDPERIHAWHAHIYYDPARTRAAAAEVRAGIAARFPAARLGNWHDVPVGPHPAAMFQVAFAPALLAPLLSWLTLNRNGLTVLIHPESGRPRDDHLHHAMWMGQILDLDPAILPETE